ncbi:hypothetical protein [Halalkalibacter nanhaiisediminis]|uniref:Phosphate transport system permease protein n=1 Tax=Halalkalibacter nanhaiisediminis TaxID=688079 RepID=A0A562QRX0_9BACI|nr:hypothetical protein [Halalkalibacter nanhaiisediminis]TWI58940.1 hypothetical protein IQ10_00648 [Halalkalibacter nanhaiisediminis]
MESQTEQKKRPAWLKWTLRVVLGYAALLAVILAITIIVILITFALIVIDGFTDSTSLGMFSETYLVPISEFMWSLFTWLIPGL